MQRLITLLAGAVLATGTVLATAACGPERTGSLGSAPTGVPPSGSASAQPSAAPIPAAPVPAAPIPAPSAVAPPAGVTPGTARPATVRAPAAGPADRPTGTVTVQVWFTRAGKVFPTRRSRPATVATSRLALTELVAGPSATEAAAGVRNGVAPGTTFQIKGISDGVATVSFPASFYAGGRTAARLRQAQVVHTLTQFRTVSKVGFLSAGAATGWPVGRSDYADLLPAIVVLDPVIGQRLTSPIRVTGTANVYEATVSLRLLDASGAEIATRFTTATCGSGCRGSYRTDLPYRSRREQRGTLQVYEVSAEDGSPLNVVDIPVVLAATAGR